MKELLYLTLSTFYLLLCCQLLCVDAFASWLKCYVDLDASEVIMNNAVILAEDSPYLVEVELKREGSDQWSTNPTFPDGTASTFEVRLRVPHELSNQDVQYAVETTAGGSFAGGMCGGRRASAIGHDRSLTLEISGKEATVEVWGGWALGHEAVKLTPRTVLRREGTSGEL